MTAIKFTESITIDRDTQTVFDYTQDYTKRLTWDTFLKGADLIDGATEAGKGVKAHCVAKNGLGMVTEYVTFNRPKVTAIKMIEGPYMFKSFLGSWVFKEAGEDATEVSFLYSFSLRFPFNMVAGFITRNLRNNVKQRLRDLKKNLENTTHMMKLNFNNYQIHCNDEYDFNSRSVDNNFQYNHIYDEDLGHYKSSLGIKIYENEEHVDSAFISSWGGGTAVHETSVIIDKGDLLVCCGHSVFCLKIPTLEMSWEVIADQATVFEIFPIKDGYITHGELQITRLDKKGIIVWQTSGADIFVTLKGDEKFEVSESHIIATDWNNDVYKIDFDGKVISDTVKR